MDAVEFIKERNRMCRHGCNTCPANELTGGCDPLETASINLLVQIVEQWSKEHPRKTMMQDFFEKFPNAPKNLYGIPNNLCPSELGYKSTHEYHCGAYESSCINCWNRPMED